MKIFDKRPLCLILCIILGSFVIFTYCGFFTLIIPALFLTISFFKYFSKIISAKFSRLLALLSILAILFSFIYFDLYFPAYKRFDGDSILVGTVMDIEEGSYYNLVTIKTENINEKPLTTYKINAYLDKNNYYNYSIGSKIELKGLIENTPSTGSNNTYYTSLGISGVVRNVTDFKVLEIQDFTFQYKITAYRKSLSRGFILKTNPEVGGLIAALLLGEREYLSPQIELDFLRLGITHILALSGTHLVILSLGLGKLLIRFGLNKKYATAASMLFTVFYMAITGFSASVTRAGIMLIISSGLFLLASAHDAMTSLFLSVAIICLITPYSIFDIGLWLSAFATLGILIMNEYPSKNLKSSVFKTIVISFLATFFALAATSFITFLKFDGVSIMSAPATLLFTVITELLIYASIFLLFMGNLAPIKIINIFIGDLTIDLAAYLSKIQGVYVSTNFSVVRITAILFTILLFLFFVLDVRHKKSVTTALFVILIGIFSLSASLTYYEESKELFLYNENKTEQIILAKDSEITMIDISNYDDIDATYAYVTTVNNKVTSIDKYIITHYSYNMDLYFNSLISKLDIRTIYLPKPRTDSEIKVCDKIEDLFKSFRTMIVFYDFGEKINYSDFTIIPIYSAKLEEEKSCLFSIEYQDRTHTYTTLSMLSGNKKEMTANILANSNAIIFGNHSKSYYYMSEKFILADTIIFSHDNTEMHKDTYDFYNSKNTHFNVRKFNLRH